MRLGDRVASYGGLASDTPLLGTFAGTATVLHDSGEIVTLYVVRLDRGFYDESRTCFTSLLLVHPDHVRQL